MGKLRDLTGQRFGRLTVTEYIGATTGRNSLYKCICKCGKEVIARADSLKSGRIKSCGCVRGRDIVGERFSKLVVVGEVKACRPNGKIVIDYLCRCDCGNGVVVDRRKLLHGEKKSCGCLQKNQLRTHSLSGTRLYKVWKRIRQRCFDKKDKNYEQYGGRGITICNEWLDFENFNNWAYENGYDDSAPKGQCTIDRIDVNGNYEPSNCRWANQTTQCNNTRRNHYYSYKGERLTAAELARKYNINSGTLYSRLERGVSINEAIERTAAKK